MGQRVETPHAHRRPRFPVNIWRNTPRKESDKVCVHWLTSSHLGMLDLIGIWCEFLRVEEVAAVVGQVPR